MVRTAPIESVSGQPQVFRDSVQLDCGLRTEDVSTPDRSGLLSA